MLLLRFFTLSLVLGSLIMMCLGLVFFMFLLFGVLLGYVDLQVSPNLEVWGHYFLKIFLTPAMLSFSNTSHICIRSLEYFPQLTEMLCSSLLPTDVFLPVSFFAFEFINFFF